MVMTGRTIKRKSDVPGTWPMYSRYGNLIAFPQSARRSGELSQKSGRRCACPARSAKVPGCCRCEPEFASGRKPIQSTFPRIGSGPPWLPGDRLVWSTYDSPSLGRSVNSTIPANQPRDNLGRAANCLRRTGVRMPAPQFVIVFSPLSNSRRRLEPESTLPCASRMSAGTDGELFCSNNRFPWHPNRGQSRVSSQQRFMTVPQKGHGSGPRSRAIADAPRMIASRMSNSANRCMIDCSRGGLSVWSDRNERHPDIRKGTSITRLVASQSGIARCSNRANSIRLHPTGTVKSAFPPLPPRG